MTADENVKKVLIALLPELKEEKEKTEQKVDTRPITERVKTFEDACKELGKNHPFVLQFLLIYDNFLNATVPNESQDLIVYLQLRIICAALNEGWEPQFSTTEWRYYPCFWLYDEDEMRNMDEETKNNRRLMSTDNYGTEYAGFGYAFSRGGPADANADCGFRLFLKSEELAVYCGKQFISLWADFYLIRKK